MKNWISDIIDVVRIEREIYAEEKRYKKFFGIMFMDVNAICLFVDSDEYYFCS